MLANLEWISSYSKTLSNTRPARQNFTYLLMAKILEGAYTFPKASVLNATRRGYLLRVLISNGDDA